MERNDFDPVDAALEQLRVALGHLVETVPLDDRGAVGTDAGAILAEATFGWARLRERLTPKPFDPGLCLDQAVDQPEGPFSA